MYSGTWVDWLFFVGTWGFFFCCFLLFLRYLPVTPAFEVRETAHKAALSGGRTGQAYAGTREW
jgi:Ni/Fe-hydrogenase subunit HybB-like protein